MYQFRYFLKSDGDTIQNLIDEFYAIYPECDKNDIKIILHGVNIPFDSELIWLVDNMSYCDGFIHLVLDF